MNERIEKLQRIEKLLEQVQVNAKIQELAKESGCTIDRLGYGEGNLEEFAELIVKECLKLCKEVEGDLAGIYEDAERDATQIGARFCYEAILSEFGVEE